MKSRILCAMPEQTFQRMFTPELAAELEALGEVIHCRNGLELGGAEYAGLWRSADAAVTGWGVRAPTAEMLQGGPVRIIAHTAGSVRMFPREAIEQGIFITTARAAIARTVAEYCLLSAMLWLRRVPLLAAGEKPLNETLFGKTVGLVGYGCVGSAFRELLRPFGCRVLVYDPFLTAEAARREKIEPADLLELFSASDIVSLHAPDVPETRGLIGGRELSALRHGAVLINSARGRLVDTDALTAAAKEELNYFILDVTDPEPLPQEHPLRGLKNVVLTPHVAGPTEDDLPSLTRMALDDLAAVLRGEAPHYSVSPQAYDRMSF
jgi:phosphoglycerate dehydrogenase-like enzyme